MTAGPPESVTLVDFGISRLLRHGHRDHPDRGDRRHHRVLRAGAAGPGRRGRRLRPVRAGLRRVRVPDRRGAVPAREPAGRGHRPPDRAAPAGERVPARPANGGGRRHRPGHGEAAGRPVPLVRCLRRGFGRRRGARGHLRPAGARRGSRLPRSGGAAAPPRHRVGRTASPGRRLRLSLGTGGLGPARSAGAAARRRSGRAARARPARSARSSRGWWPRRWPGTAAASLCRRLAARALRPATARRALALGRTGWPHARPGRRPPRSPARTWPPRRRRRPTWSPGSGP